jgi:2-hydroxy-4-carboxymuconate semialdehyde hemiacetal dehydrogenase
MRIALVGYGAVATIHARKLQKAAQLLTIWGPDQDKAEAFAEELGIQYSEKNLKSTLEHSDGVVICSPSSVHYEQTKEALIAGKHVLVEFPVCTSAAETRELGALASAHNLTLQCAHTSRHLEPYKRLKQCLADGVLGEILHVHYIRLITPRTRSWRDDALWHHAGHPLDLFLDWFGSLRPLACSAFPSIPEAQNVSLLACTSAGAPIAISISYESRLPETRLTVIGSKHTVATDGFSYVAFDEDQFVWKGDERQTYEDAIEEQDVSFLNACKGIEGGIPWNETLRLSDCTTAFIDLWKRP